jgi:hypothetical protein
MRKLFLSTALAVVLVAPAIAQTIPTMGVTEFLLDWKQYEGRVIKVTDCAFSMVGTALVYCNDKDRPNAFFAIRSGDTLPRDDRKVLLSGCKVYPTPNCVGDVTGTVFSDVLSEPTIKPSGIFWTKKPGGMM